MTQTQGCADLAKPNEQTINHRVRTLRPPLLRQLRFDATNRRHYQGCPNVGWMTLLPSTNGNQISLRNLKRRWKRIAIFQGMNIHPTVVWSRE